MGMYTEIKVDCIVRPVDQVSLDALRIMFDWPGPGSRSPRQRSIASSFSLPDAPLFRCARWHSIGRCGSAYFDAEPSSKMEDLGDGTWRITSISNLKNYDDEIGKFFDWLRPMVVGTAGQVIGHQWYEQERHPTEVRL